MSDLRLVIFDVDGTLVDSQADIAGAMRLSFAAAGLPAPTHDDVLSIVGLSLPEAMRLLHPSGADADIDRLVVGYKDAYMTLRAEIGADQSSPLYPGVRQVLDDLKARDDVLLALATGKSKRGLDKLIEGHQLHGYFQSQQVSDFHPSKPNPSMIFTAMSECGVDAAQTVMVGDTTFDMDMARAAKVPGIGVDWGYHPAEMLGTPHIISHMSQLPGLLPKIWG
ncbi:HAD-IA family hydrolase [Aestuariibius sp. HNIBRBA575]|uniref:HAD-IA family hydrolase n=1 Tax=Aestuariibius sp. HNIBRBA575 TaxID=3233343 RepID=UPI0034A203E7